MLKLDSLRCAARALIAAGALAVTALLSTTAHAAPVITWRLENAFRLFTDPADTEMHRATFAALTPAERLNPILSAERALQARHADGWAAPMYRRLCWNWNSSTYQCPEYGDYTNPKSHVIIAEIAGLEDADTLTCTWLTAPHGGGSPRGKAVTQACNEPFMAEVPYPSGADVSVELGGREIAKAPIKVRDILVVGMGDSFGSGEGNPDIAVRFSRERAADYGKSQDLADLAGYPARIGNWSQIGDKAFISENARWSDQACHRSLYSHQLRAGLQLAVEDPHRAVTFVGLACSGAEVTFGLFLRYKGNEWVPNPPRLSQFSAAAEVQCGQGETNALDLPETYHLNGRIPELKGGLVLRKCPRDRARKIDLVLLSVGGNDVGFSRLVANAVLADQSTLRKLGGWFGEVHGQAEASSQLARLDARYKSLNRAIHSLLYVPWEESDRIVLASYPGMALTGDGSETCKDGRAGLEVVSDFALSERKLREGAWIADKLHRAMRDSAGEYKWTFVEAHRRDFIDRGICSGKAEDGSNAAEDLRLPRKTAAGWKPYNPADFAPYVQRQRWFRTPNDAFMTGNFHVAASVLQKVLKLDSLAWFQLVLASTYSGAFHPTAEGHAAIADAVASKARAVLSKYGQGPDPEAIVETEQPAPPAFEPGELAIPAATPGAAVGAPVGATVGAPAATTGAAPAATPDSAATTAVTPAAGASDGASDGAAVGSDRGPSNGDRLSGGEPAVSGNAPASDSTFGSDVAPSVTPPVSPPASVTAPAPGGASAAVPHSAVVTPEAPRADDAADSDAARALDIVPDEMPEIDITGGRTLQPGVEGDAATDDARDSARNGASSGTPADTPGGSGAIDAQPLDDVTPARP
ncbi:MAG: hypothetical protein ACRCS9_15500 [Hyphomicrobium sp.]